MAGLTEMASDGRAPRALPVDGTELLSVAKAATDAGNGIWILVRGASMLPAIPRFALIHVVRARPDEVRRGDIVLARSADGHPVVHRVWFSLGQRLWLKGDFRVTPDAPITRSAVVGVVEAVRYGNRLSPPPARVSLAPLDVARRWRAFARDLVIRG